MQFRKLQFNPGINRETTRYSNSGGWWDCDKMRFRNGMPEKIGGWIKNNDTAFDGVCRHLRTFRILDGTVLTAVGTHTRFYIEWSGGLNELTPWTDADTSLTDPFTTTNLDDEVQVTKTTHGLAEGDRVDITGSSAVGGIAADDINGVRTVTTIVDPNTYKFTAGAAATSSTTGGGSPVGIYYLFPDGFDTQIKGTGWGRSSWGSGAWGSPIVGYSVADNQLRTWTTDTFGEDLFLCAYGSSLFYWDATNGYDDPPVSRPYPLDQVVGSSGAPSVGRICMVSQRDRHAIVFGCDPLSDPGVMDPMLIRWADQENIAQWTPSTDNTAGSILLSGGSEIVTAKKARNEILIWTDTDLHSMQYIGGDFIYGAYLLARNVSILDRNCAVVHNGVAYWMGDGAFYMYDGQVRELPSTVADYVFQDINLTQSGKIFAGVFGDQGEIIWFYPSASSDDCDKYVIFNIVEGVWYFGNMERTCWQDATIYDYPLAASTDNFLYFHEIGELDNSTSPASQIVAHIESSPVEISEGYQFTFVDRIIPDITFREVGGGNTSVTMTVKAYRNSGSAVHDTGDGDVTRIATSPIETFTEDVWVRLRGRALTFRFEDTAGVANPDFGWRLGTPRISARSDGRR